MNAFVLFSNVFQTHTQRTRSALVIVFQCYVRLSTYCFQRMWTTCRQKGLSFSNWVSKRHSYVLENKTRQPRPLSNSTAMITVPDRNRRHMIVSALSLRSRRATGGLRRPSESRALLAFPRLSLPVGCVAQQPNRPFNRDYASKQRRSEDPKGMYIDTGTQGIRTSASRSRRWIPSISS